MYIQKVKLATDVHLSRTRFKPLDRRNCTNKKHCDNCTPKIFLNFQVDLLLVLKIFGGGSIAIFELLEKKGDIKYKIPVSNIYYSSEGNNKNFCTIYRVASSDGSATKEKLVCTYNFINTNNNKFVINNAKVNINK